MNPTRTTAQRKAPGHRTATLLAGGILAAALAGLTAAPATADAGPAMQLSTDGIHFTSRQAPEVFPQMAGMVPGESRPGTIWVRNAGAEPAIFALAVRSTSGSAVLTDSLELLAGSRGHADVTAPLAAPGQCRSIFHGWTLRPGESLRLNLALGMDIAATNATRHESAGVQLIFLMQGHGGGTPVPACPAPGEPSAWTGLRQVVGASVATAGAQPAREAAARQPGVDHQAAEEPDRAMQSNVVGNDQRPAQLLAIASGLFLFTALAKRRRNS